MAADAPMTFIVRIAAAGAGCQRGIERVRTGRKESAHAIEDMGRAITAMAFEEAAANDTQRQARADHGRLARHRPKLRSVDSTRNKLNVSLCKTQSNADGRGGV